MSNRQEVVVAEPTWEEMQRALAHCMPPVLPLPVQSKKEIVPISSESVSSGDLWSSNPQILDLRKNKGSPIVKPGSANGSQTDAKYRVVFESSADDGVLITVLKPGQEVVSSDKKPDYPYADKRYQEAVYELGRRYRFEFDSEGNQSLKAPLQILQKYEYAEHKMMGELLTLQWHDGSTKSGHDTLTLDNGVTLTYGQMNALGGDFYGTYNPICQGENFKAQCDRFKDAYATLAENRTRTPTEVYKIIDNRKAEVEAVANVLRKGFSENPDAELDAYISLGDDTAGLQEITFLRPIDEPGYIGLLGCNLDHFGEDAHTAYEAGHYLALERAAGGSPQDLEAAYALNAFADHFIGDSFAAGHMRTPRRKLHEQNNKIADLCSSYMHDEDNALGLRIANRAGETWMAYGDKRMFAPKNGENARRLRQCLQASVNEVFNAWKNKSFNPNPASFAAWEHAPTLESARGPQDHEPLFTLDGQIRDNVSDRHCKEHHSLAWYETWLEVWGKLKMSSAFTEPIHM